MDRRQLLQAASTFGFGAVLPASAPNELQVGIVGIGGAGGNVLHFIAEKLPDSCRTVAIDTHADSLRRYCVSKTFSQSGFQSCLSISKVRGAATSHDAALPSLVGTFTLCSRFSTRPLHRQREKAPRWTRYSIKPHWQSFSIAKCVTRTVVASLLASTDLSA